MVYRLWASSFHMGLSLALSPNELRANLLWSLQTHLDHVAGLLLTRETPNQEVVGSSAASTSEVALGSYLY